MSGRASDAGPDVAPRPHPNDVTYACVACGREQVDSGVRCALHGCEARCCQSCFGDEPRCEGCGKWACGTHRSLRVQGIRAEWICTACRAEEIVGACVGLSDGGEHV